MKTVSKIFILISIFINQSCGVKWTTDEYGKAVPVKPTFKLKDAVSDELPKNLDTINLYKYVGYYDFSSGFVNDEKFEGKENYLKFSPNGRAFSFSTKRLEEDNLNPNFASKSYYIYDKKKDVIKKEFFTIANGGQYSILNYKIYGNGDTLRTIDRYNEYRALYVKVKLPAQWKKYSVNW